MVIGGHSSDNFDCSVFCLLTLRLNEWIITNGAPSRKIKAVCFMIVSHDQGWASENDFAGKYIVSHDQGWVSENDFAGKYI